MPRFWRSEGGRPHSGLWLRDSRKVWSGYRMRKRRFHGGGTIGIAVSYAPPRITGRDSEALTSSEQAVREFCQDSGERALLLAISLALRPLSPWKTLPHSRFGLEARVGIEPTNAAFAEPCLTTWLPRPPNRTLNLVPGSHSMEVLLRNQVQLA